jgi:hypothetical protein
MSRAVKNITWQNAGKNIELRMVLAKYLAHFEIEPAFL